MKLIKLVIRTTILAICLIVTLGCSTTTVHVNKLYLNEQQAQKIKSKLNQLGLDVEFNALRFPTNITSTSVLYSPFVTDNRAISKIENTLIELGYGSSNVNALVTSNHWYTKDTVGLFIVPRGVVPHSGRNTKDIAYQYRSEKCEKLTTLTLQKSGIFILKVADGEEVKGHWSMTEYPYIVLENKTPYLHYYFEIKRSKKIDKISEIDIIDIQPMSSSLLIPSCTLTYGERV